VRSEYERSEHIFGNARSGIAEDFGIARFHADDCQGRDPGVHARDNGKATYRSPAEPLWDKLLDEFSIRRSQVIEVTGHS